MTSRTFANPAAPVAEREAAQAHAGFRWYRPELAGGVAIAALLALMAVVDVAPGPSPATVTLTQMAHDTRLFHRVVPAIVALPIQSFALFTKASIVALWLVYLWLIWRLRARPVCLPLVVGGAVGFGLLAAIVPPLFSTDSFSYAIFGRLASVYHVNPYLVTPAQGAAHDPLLPYVFWSDIPTPYGPLWTLISAAIAYGRDALPVGLVVRFKLLALAGTWLNGGLVYLMAKRVNRRWAGWAYLAFAWNPLVLVSGPLTGHNDVFTLTFVLAGAYLIERAPKAGVASLTASVLIKYSTVPMLSIAAVRFIWRAPRRLWSPGVLVAAGCGLALAIAAFFPFWHGLSTLQSAFAEPGRGVTNPLIRMMSWTVFRLSHGAWSLSSPMASVGVAFVLFAAWELWQWRREGGASGPWTFQDELASWGETATAFLVVWPRDRTWYWLVPLGLALIAGPRHRYLTFCVLFGSFIAYSYSMS